MLDGPAELAGSNDLLPASGNLRGEAVQGGPGFLTGRRVMSNPAFPGGRAGAYSELKKSRLPSAVGSLLSMAFFVGKIPLQDQRRRYSIHGFLAFFGIFSVAQKDLMGVNRSAALVP